MRELLKLLHGGSEARWRRLWKLASKTSPWLCDFRYDWSLRYDWYDWYD